MRRIASFLGIVFSAFLVLGHAAHAKTFSLTAEWGTDLFRSLEGKNLKTDLVTFDPKEPTLDCTDLVSFLRSHGTSMRHESLSRVSATGSSASYERDGSQKFKKPPRALIPVSQTTDSRWLLVYGLRTNPRWPEDAETEHFVVILVTVTE